MRYIVDSCIWIDFFAKKKHVESISSLLMDDLAFVNKIILSELLPSARMKKENDFIDSISGIEIIELAIDWDELEEIQFNCLKSGINKLGLLDIAIAQNAKQNGMGIFSTDRHMELLSRKLEIKLKAE
jgi:hypothetical protein